MINIKNFDPDLLSIDKTPFKSIDATTYRIKYITMKSLDYVNIDCENSIHLSLNNVVEYIEKNYENKCLVFTSRDKNKEILEKYAKLWNRIKNQIKTINGGECNSNETVQYKKDFMKIRFESDDDLPLGKILSILVMKITRSVFQEGSKYYPQVLLHECV